MTQMKQENIGGRTFLVYTLPPAEILDTVTLGMMEHNSIQGLLPLAFLQKDEQQILKYDTSGTAVLEDYLENRNGLEFVSILKNMADILNEADEYMIGEEFFLFETQSVFVGKDGGVQMICLPVRDKKGKSFQQFCMEMTVHPAVSRGPGYEALVQVKDYLAGEKSFKKEFSAKEFSLVLDKIELRTAVSPAALKRKPEPVVFGKRKRVIQPVVLSKRKGNDTVLKPEQTKMTGCLYRKSSGEKITVSREEFYIGKSSGHADYCIPGNSFVSRRHAKITRQGDDFYITDMNSLNHTYADGTMLKGGQPVPLRDGMVIRLADVEFIFRTERV